jgi:RluA family pseudouridine synthase
MKTVIVQEEGKLLEYLMKTLTVHKRKELKQFLNFGAISVNGEVTTKFDFPLRTGDKIDIQTDKKTKKPHFIKSQLEIIHEDDDILVINKPAGLLSIATETEKMNTAYFMMTDYVRAKSESEEARIFIVHRLDRDVSGLLVFAKNEKAKHALQDQWDDVERRYYAVVEGTPEKKQDKIESYLFEDQLHFVHSGKKRPGAKLAITNYRAIQWNEMYALLEVITETGRKNQIRVHLANIRHPIVGDKKYGAKTDPARRIGLHAYYLAFQHPTTQEKLVFQNELPRTLSQLIQ